MFRKIFIASIVMIILIIASYFAIINIIINAVIDEKEIANTIKSELIGEKIIVNNDTLIITEFIYNPWGSKVTAVGNNFTPKITVDVEFAKKNLIKDDN